MSPALLESFNLLFIGLSVVFAALFFFYVLIVVIGKINAYFNKRKVAKKLGNEPSKKRAILSDEIDPEVIAVIAASVFATLQTKVRVKSIRFLTQPDDTSWSRIGRLSLIESHHIKINK
jgi:sodium pump decarboxylase gamma subunit